jgi:hypothetical protein
MVFVEIRSLRFSPINVNVSVRFGHVHLWTGATSLPFREPKLLLALKSCEC